MTVNKYIISNILLELSLLKRFTDTFDWQPSQTENVQEIEFTRDDVKEVIEGDVNNVKDEIWDCNTIKNDFFFVQIITSLLILLTYITQRPL